MSRWRQTSGRATQLTLTAARAARNAFAQRRRAGAPATRAFVERERAAATGRRRWPRPSSSASALVAEAGTGVGKTFAYLVPLLLSGRRALVSTATKSLQDQLFLRDLPRLRDALRPAGAAGAAEGPRQLPVPAPPAAVARRAPTLPDRCAVRALARIETMGAGHAHRRPGRARGPGRTLAGDPAGDLDARELPGHRVPAVHRDCHVMQARREAMAADLVVINHHLFFADLALRDSGVAELLPTVDVAVFDEAHQLVETGVQFLGAHLGTGQVIDFARDLLAAGLQQARGLRDWQSVAAGCEQAARDLRLACAGPLRELRGVDQAALGRARRAAGVSSGAAGARRGAAAHAWRRSTTAERDRARFRHACRSVRSRAGAARSAFCRPCAPGAGALDRRRAAAGPAGRVAAGHSRHADRTARQRAAQAWIFTSATLGDDDAPELVHRSQRRWRTPSSCASAARSTTRPTRGCGCRALAQAQRSAATRRRSASWRARLRAGVWAAAPSC